MSVLGCHKLSADVATKRLDGVCDGSAYRDRIPRDRYSVGAQTVGFITFIVVYCCVNTLCMGYCFLFDIHILE